MSPGAEAQTGGVASLWKLLCWAMERSAGGLQIGQAQNTKGSVHSSELGTQH